MSAHTEKKNPSRSPKGLLFVLFMTGAGLVFLDQITKALVTHRFKDQPPFVLIDGVLELTYVENRGAAFGILQNRQWFFWILTAVFLFAAIYVLYRVPKHRRYLPLMISVTVLAAGAVGNLIDRVVHRYVVDFIYFSLINFPVFNVADICVTLSVVAILILVLFRYKEKELEFLSFKKKKSAGAEIRREEEPLSDHVEQQLEEPTEHAEDEG